MAMDDSRVFRDYLIFTVPHITVFAGALFGLLVLLGLNVELSAGIFAVVYGFMLTVLALIIRPHVAHLRLYWVFLAFSLLVFGAGLVTLLVSLTLG